MNYGRYVNRPSIFEMCFLTFPSQALQCNDTLNTTCFCRVGLCEGIWSDSDTQSPRRYTVDDDEPLEFLLLEKLKLVTEPFLRVSLWGKGLIGNMDEQGRRGWIFLLTPECLLVLLRTVERVVEFTAVEAVEQQNNFIPFMAVIICVFWEHTEQCSEEFEEVAECCKRVMQLIP